MRQVIFAAALLVAGCGGGPDLACDLVQKNGGVTSHGCSEVDGLGSSQIDAAAQQCTEIGGTVVDSCSGDGDLGVCTITQGGLTQGLHFYSDGGVTEAIAAKACEDGKGTWAPN
jgi:hypothetical protein